MRLAERINAIQPSSIVALADRARELERNGEHVIRLETGEPNMASPHEAQEACSAALLAGQTHYSHSMGLPELRQEIADWYNRAHGVHFDHKNQIIITPGGKQAILYIILALINAGDEVVVPDPGWVSYAEIVKLAGGVPVAALANPAENFRITYAAVAAAVTDKTRLVILNSPCNPTGQVVKPGELSKIVDLCRARDVLILSDEIYDQITFAGQTAPSIVQADPDLTTSIVLNGFSKTYAMTGWRLGYLIAQPELISAVSKLQQNSITCPSTFLQYGALAALQRSHDFVVAAMHEYQENLDYLINELTVIKPIRTIIPSGGLYMFLNISEIEPSSEKFAMKFLDAKRVTVVPGIAFGQQGEGFIRICIATERQNLETFIQRLKEFIHEIGP